MNQIVAFYSSPVGQKVLKGDACNVCGVYARSNTGLQPRIDVMMKNLDARIQEMVDDENGKSR
ncbi:MAG: DUF2059 domain-containing protein [Terriglobales bacterium]